MSEEARILEAFFGKWLRMTKLVLVISMIALALGASSIIFSLSHFTPEAPLTTQATIHINAIRIVEHNEYLAFEVNLSSNIWPIEASLFYENETILGEPNFMKHHALDHIVINDTSEIPIYLTPFRNLIFALICWRFQDNLPPGPYAILVSHGNTYVWGMITIGKIRIAILNAKFTICTRTIFGETEWYIANVTLTIQNKGNHPTYISSANIEAPDVNQTAIYRTKAVLINPGEQKTLTLNPFSYGIFNTINFREPGSYTIIIRIDFGYTTVEYETTLTVG